jgi:UDP-glucose 4-epimerase
MAAEAKGPVLVTGGAGAIGGVLVATLLRQGREVTVLDNLSSGRLENLGEAPLDPRFRFVRADLLHPEEMRPSFRGASEVWHLAANPDIRRGTADPRVDLEQGTLATFAVLEAMRANDVRRLVFSSSSVVYGYPATFPTPESYGPLLPQSQYAASKLACEGLVSSFAHSYGLEATIFRFANIVGPGMTHGVMYDFFLKLRRDPSRLEVLGDGRQTKGYLLAQDCVDGMLFARDRAAPPVDVFNLAPDDQSSVREIAETGVAAFGGRARIEMTGGARGWVGDVPRQQLDTKKMRALGWAPRHGSGEAVDRAIGYLRQEFKV